jgi:glucose/arabinose dehydrogenase
MSMNYRFLPKPTLNRLRLILSLALLTASVSSAANTPNYEMTTVAEGLDFPWCVAFLPNGDRLVTELSGQLRRVSEDGTLSEPIAGVPPVYRDGQGGLFDVLPHPDFANNQMIYLSFAAGDTTSNGTTVARGRLNGNSLEDLQVIFSVAPKKYAPLHYGGRLAWQPDGTLLLTTGDGFDFREKAQDPSTQLGKTIRMQEDGSPATGNPFADAPYVWTFGHRNPQGLAVGADGTVYQHEHGPRGGDEVNILVAGKNYGWPAITYGIDYNGAYVTPFTEHDGMQQPDHIWVPSIAPSGLMVYEGSMFPDWHGDLFVGALVDAEVRHLDMENGKVVNEEAVFPEISARIRDIRQAPDGSIYVIIDGAQGSIVRITAK